jgi:hypothetical protein
VNKKDSLPTIKKRRGRPHPSLEEKILGQIPVGQENTFSLPSEPSIDFSAIEQEIMNKYQAKGEILQSQIDDIIAIYHLEEDDVDKLTTFILSNFQVIDDSEEDEFEFQNEDLVLEDSDSEDIAKDVKQVNDY